MNDLRLALTAKRNAAIAARAVLTQATADEARYAMLVKNGFAASPQRYEQAKAALDTAKAQAAAASADWAAAGDFGLVLANAPGEQSYPITATVFVLMNKGMSQARARATFNFFRWSLDKGGADATQLGYVPLPESLVKDVRFAFIKKETALVMGSPRKFTRHGQSGTWISDALPNIAQIADDIAVVNSMNTDQFNHAPAELLLYTGSPNQGRPSMGSWVTYGLGTENDNLPGFVVLNFDVVPCGGMENFSSGFLPASHQATILRAEGTPLDNIVPAARNERIQRTLLDLMGQQDQRFSAALGQSDAEGQAIAEGLMSSLGVGRGDLLEGAYMDLLDGR